jgi:hypothetical protein
MNLQRTLSFAKVYIGLVSQAFDVNHWNVIGEFQQSKIGLQSLIDYSRKCRVRDGIGLRNLEWLLLLFFDGSD